jgi:hypothetical protein
MVITGLHGMKIIILDTFGLIPPKELIKYLKSPILHNRYQIQQFNDEN